MPRRHIDSRRNDVTFAVNGLRDWASPGLDLSVDACFAVAFEIICCITRYVTSDCLLDDDSDGRQQFDATLSIDMGRTQIPLDEVLAPILDRHAAKWKKAGNQQLTQLGSSIAYQLLLRDPSRSHELREELLAAEDVMQISLYGE